MKAIANNIRIAPKKANLIAGLVRRKSVQEALDILKFTTKKAAPILYKVIYSAAANAESNLKQKKEDLYIKEIVVTEGPTYKRGVPASRSRVHPILKKTSHISVYLATAPKVQKEPASKSLESAATEPSTKEKIVRKVKKLSTKETNK